MHSTSSDQACIKHFLFRSIIHGNVPEPRGYYVLNSLVHFISVILRYILYLLYYDTKKISGKQTILCVAGKRTNSISITRKALHISIFVLIFRFILLLFIFFQPAAAHPSLFQLLPYGGALVSFIFHHWVFCSGRCIPIFFCFHICLSFCLYHFLYFTKIGVKRPKTWPSILCSFWKEK